MAAHTHRLCRPIPDLDVLGSCRCTQQVAGMIPVSSTTSGTTIGVLRDLFARFGIPKQIVSDNGPQFVSEDFQTFARSNGIHHITSAPYHPATNGLAERSVQTLEALRSMQGSSKPVKEKLAKFLTAYRNTPHSNPSTVTPWETVTHPPSSQLEPKDGQKGRQRRQLEVGDSVMSRDYRGELKWRSGLIVKKTGPLMYEV